MKTECVIEFEEVLQTIRSNHPDLSYILDKLTIADIFAGFAKSIKMNYALVGNVHVLRVPVIINDPDYDGYEIVEFGNKAYNLVINEFTPERLRLFATVVDTMENVYDKLHCRINTKIRKYLDNNEVSFDVGVLIFHT